MNDELFQDGLCLTFDDVLVLPGYAEVLPSDADVHVPWTLSLRRG